MPVIVKLFITHCFIFGLSLLATIFYANSAEIQSERTDDWVYGTFCVLLIGLVLWAFYIIWGVW